MVRLKNIEIDNNIISCEIFPEDSVQSGKLKVDINSQDIIRCLLDLNGVNLMYITLKNICSQI